MAKNKNCKVTRREFMKLMSACGCGLAAHSMVGGSTLAHALIPGRQVGLLGLIFLDGGADLASMFQSTHAEFRVARPTLGLNPNVLLPSGRNDVGLHPNAAFMSQSILNGELALYQFLGMPYPGGNADRGHDTARDKVFAGRVEMGSTALAGSSFIANLASQVAEQNGVFLINTANAEISNGTTNGIATSSLSNGGIGVGAVDNSFGAGQNESKYRNDMSAALRSGFDPNALVSTAQRQLLEIMKGGDTSLSALRTALSAIPAPTVAFPGTSFGTICNDLYRASRLPGVGVVISQRGGWDTHSNQAGGFGQAVTELDQALSILKTNLGALWNNTAIMVISEFGRTSNENGSQGTDHGWGNQFFAVGGAVNGGVKGPVLPGSFFNQSRGYYPATDDLRLPIASALRAITSGTLDIGSIFPGMDVGQIPNFNIIR